VCVIARYGLGNTGIDTLLAGRVKGKLGRITLLVVVSWIVAKVVCGGFAIWSFVPGLSILACFYGLINSVVALY